MGNEGIKAYNSRGHAIFSKKLPLLTLLGDAFFQKLFYAIC